MYVGVAVFEIHMPFSRSLKEKRGVVRSVRDRLRTRSELSVAEVALQDLHQRARLAISMVSGDRRLIEQAFQSAQETAADCDGEILGWNEDIFQFDDDDPVDVPAMDDDYGD
jgi:uncharacterized protein YlxP (DUF503 family)